MYYFLSSTYSIIVKYSKELSYSFIRNMMKAYSKVIYCKDQKLAYIALDESENYDINS